MTDRVHPAIKSFDAGFTTGFNEGWNDAIAECVKHLEAIGARYHTGRDLCEHLRRYIHPAAPAETPKG